MGQAVPISYLDLAIASGLVMVSILLSSRLSLGLQRDMLLGALRTFLQLSVTGYVLVWIINRSRLGEWYWVLLALGVMLVVAVYTARGRMQEAMADKTWVFAVAIVSGSLVVLIYILALVLRIKPWYNGQYVLPLAGMIIGNAMNAGALGVGRFAGDLHNRREEVETALALGATASQAVADIRRDALRTAIIPSVNGMLVVGIVSLPGMMTGQILAGQSPTQAVHYQIVVMYMITAAAALTSIAGVVAATRRAFTPAQQLRALIGEK